MTSKKRIVAMVAAVAMLGCKGVQPTSAASGGNSGAVTTDGNGSGGSSGASADSNATRVEYIKDGTLNNMTVVGVRIPADWKFQGTLIQGANCVQNPYVVWRATSPDGKSMFERMPVLGWMYGTSPSLNRPGANHGCLPMKGAMPAVEVARYMVSLMKVEPVEIEPFPEAVEAQLERSAANTVWKRVQGANATVRFMNGSTVMKGGLRVVVRCKEAVIPAFSAAQSATTIDQCVTDMQYATSPESEWGERERQWSEPGMGNGQGNLDWQAASEQRSEQYMQQQAKGYIDASNKNFQSLQESFRHEAAVQQQMHNEFMDTMARGTANSMAATQRGMDARGTATSDWVDYALDRKTIMDTSTGAIYKTSNQVTPGGAAVQVHGDGTPIH